MKTRAAKKIESVGPGGCACLCKSCDDQRHCHRPEKGCRANEPAPKRKPTKRAERANDHPSDCSYHRYRGTVNQDRRAYQQFDRLAKMLGEVEAALDAFYQISRKHGLLCAPDDGSAAICPKHAAAVHQDVNTLTALLSPEAKMLLPILFMVAGGQVTVERCAPEGETVH